MNSPQKDAGTSFSLFGYAARFVYPDAIGTAFFCRYPFHASRFELRNRIRRPEIEKNLKVERPLNQWGGTLSFVKRFCQSFLGGVTPNPVPKKS